MLYLLRNFQKEEECSKQETYSDSYMYRELDGSVFIKEGAWKKPKLASGRYGKFSPQSVLFYLVTLKENYIFHQNSLRASFICSFMDSLIKNLILPFKGCSLRLHQ